MATFFMLGKYSSDAVKDMSPNRTDKAVRLIRELEGEVKNMYALLGEYDIAMVIEMKNNEIAMKASLALSMLTGITFDTMPAVSVDDFDRIIGEI